VKGIARRARKSPLGWVSVIASVSPCATMPVTSVAWPLWYSVAPTMSESHRYALLPRVPLSTRSIEYFMLAAVTTPLAGGEKA